MQSKVVKVQAVAASAAWSGEAHGFGELPLSSVARKVLTVTVMNDFRTCSLCFCSAHFARDCQAATTGNGSGQSHFSGLVSSC